VCKVLGNKFSELRVMRAYIRLFLVPEGKDGARTVSLARIGNYEVRFVELSRTSSPDKPPLWMELYAHDEKLVVDSCSFHELEEAVVAAEHLILQASCLTELTRDQGNEMPCP
jgi:hypothetical protein